MDWISKEFLLAVCISLLIALVAVSWSRPLIQGPPPKAAERSQGATEANNNRQPFDYTRFRNYIDAPAGYCTSERPNAQSEWRKKFICESKITDVVVAVLTLFLAIFTGLLVWVGNKQEKTTRRQMRAFVFATGFELAPNTVNGRIKEYVFFAPIENVGLTPANDMQVQILIKSYPMNEDIEPHFEWKSSVPAAALGPRGKGRSGFYPISIETLIELWENKTAIYIATHVEYRDIFNPSVVHRHEQCSVMELIYYPADIRPPGHHPPILLMAYGPQNTTS